ncbi:F0F1 ATP synthase subunit A [Duncaniella dubosii]|nr:F0F1 ATP synthase subunit A [Duncaniella dubosii]MBJ2191161.1 F0F1 ATP synthase subunit A [Muribaculaceae bacterium]MCX4283375.1 F0F1 ATP synthase subunit A [Duncaniella dubosii]HBN63651.1 ATP synthase F0 subunit A [Porphyromonadaceae bacterium]
MKRNIFTALLLAVMALVFPLGMAASEETPLDSLVEKDSSVDAQGIIFDHLGDRYGWEVPFNHHKSIPLPVIVWGSDGLHVFSSARVDHGAVYRDGNAEFKVAGKDSPYKGKVVELVNGQEVKPAVDISITKNVCGVFISVLLVIWCILSVARWHKSQGMKGPRKMTGAIELVILFIYDGVIKPTLKNKANKFAPYLLTVFFFILVMNLLGLIVIFPGGANLTGNIAVTLVLAIITFLITNIFATKHYWKEVFNPDVPWWFKWPIPIMPVIEIFGIFTKPAALTVRLFANMMGGHMIVIVLTLLIFIFAAMGPVVTGATAVVSIIFSVFMLLLDVLVSFIQAYVFTMLSTLFIALGQEEGHHEEHGNDGHHDGSKHLQDAKTQSSPSANPA